MSVRMNVTGNAIWPTDHIHSRPNSTKDVSLPPIMSPTMRHVMNTATSVMNRLSLASSFTGRIVARLGELVCRARLMPRCRAMRWSALAPLVAVTGCNWIFGLQETAVTDGGPGEAPPGPRTKLVWAIATTDGVPGPDTFDPT